MREFVNNCNNADENPKVFLKCAVIYDGCIKYKRRKQMTDYSNFKLNMAHMNAFIENEGGKISDEDSAKLNTIFKECDTEGAQNDKGENIGDGVLNMKEFVNFLSKVKSSCPNIFYKFVAFLTADKKAQTDDTAAIEEEIYQRLKDEQKANDKARVESNIKFGLDNTGNYDTKVVNQWQNKAAKKLQKTNAEMMKKIERQELIFNFKTEWIRKIDNKTLTTQLKELDNIQDKETFDKTLTEFNTKNRQLAAANNIKFGLGD